MDLEQEQPGQFNFDLEGGIVRERQGYRLVAPDFELGLGLADRIELIVDSAYNVTSPTSLGRVSFDSGSFDNLWLASRVAFFDHRDRRRETAWALGAQLGPKLPIATAARGVGYEAVAIGAAELKRLHWVVNAGAVLEPGSQGQRGEPFGVEGGIDTTMDFIRGGSLAIDVELSGVHYLTAYQDQFALNGGIQWSPNENLDLALMGLWGLAGDDRYGVLLELSPTISFWR